TTLTSSQNPSAFGRAVTFTATVGVNSPGAGTPTGTVTFEDGGVALPNGTVNLTTVGGQQEATYTTSALSVATHSITAVYKGDTNDAGSTGTLTNGQTVNADSTSTVVSSSVNNPSAFGQSVTFTATVSVNSPGAGTPTGTVTFEDGGVALPNGTVNLTTVGGQQEATYTTSALSVATHSITAVYKGDTNDAGSTGTLTNGQTVNADSTSTVVSSSVNNPSAFGQSVTFTAT